MLVGFKNIASFLIAWFYLVLHMVFWYMARHSNCCTKFLDRCVKRCYVSHYTNIHESLEVNKKRNFIINVFHSDIGHPWNKILPKTTFITLGGDYMESFQPGLSFSPDCRAEISARPKN